MWLTFIGFTIGMLVGAIISFVSIFRENGKWSTGWDQGYDAAKKTYTNYDKGFKDGVNAAYKAMENITVEHYSFHIKEEESESDKKTKEE